MALEQPIGRVAEALEKFLSNVELEPSFLHTPFDFSLHPEAPQITSILEKIDLKEVLTLEEDSEAQQTAKSQIRDFVALSGLSNAVDRLISEIQHADQTLQNGELPEQHVLAICKLSLLLEWQIHQIHSNHDGASKSDFFTLLQLILDSLFAISTNHISKFWDFLELRIEVLKTKVFDKSVTLHRIALLGLCNSLTDKYYIRNSQKKLDSYAKDTFNDEFHARVRMFLANMLSFDDLTGLNKYFAIANRENKEPTVTRSAKMTDDDYLLQDVLSLYKLLRNPYFFLKSPRNLRDMADSLDKLTTYLLDQEGKYARRHPGTDTFAVLPVQLEAEILRATEKLKRIVFFPEYYWLAPFDKKKDDDIMRDDQRTLLKQLGSSPFRRFLLIQIYLVCSFFVELLATNKRALLKSTEAPTNIKHLSDDSTPEIVAKIFFKNKKEIVRQCRLWDSQLSYLLQNLSLAEAHWWSWLLYGKDSSGKPLLTDKTLSDEQLASTQAKLESAFAFKSKRYFNTHATPQLSRKMKTQTGLHLLERSNTKEQDYAQKIGELKRSIEEAHEQGDEEKENELFEEKTILLWKQLKEARLKQWLQLGELLDPLELENKKKDNKMDNEKENLEKNEPETQNEAEPDLAAKSDAQADNEAPESKKRARSPDEEEEIESHKKAKTE